ncbi:glutathione S-transferase family protein [Motilimonas eburnea]|uniref:glutathione S-transferase family protein n=1 Tax=Motilimonas eburnea TaxID=1737488 RepID=UPI001E2C7BEA|nr:glutathione S-transferase family protein [Motilimonas eburnea]MCE2572953.1 glutathione S-transferase family protein [Motilimonas eburnea]
MYKLYYAPNNASLAPHFILHHVQADYELVLVDRKAKAQKSTAYLALNPAGRIPTLLVDQQAIFESSAICIHLCELFPEYGLMPAIDEPQRPLFFQWLAYLNNTLQTALMARYYPQRHTQDESGWAAVIAAQDKLISEALGIINSQLSHQPYLLGARLTACDYFLFMLAGWALPVNPSPFDFPHLAAYLKRMATKPVIQSVCAVEGISLAAFG